jgi:dihydroorotase
VTPDRNSRYQLIVKGGRVFDPARGLDGILDVGISDGRVESVAPNLAASDASEVVDAQGLLVVPGLVDFHSHVYWGGSWSGVDADAVAPLGGVTTFVDAGTSGAGNFPGFLAHVIKPARTRILAFLNISFPGLIGALGRVDVPEAGDVRLMNVSEAVRMAQAHPDVIRGIKVRLGRHGSGSMGTTALRMAIEAAEILGLPVLAHIDDPPPRVVEVLDLLRPGDILTHVCRRPPNSLVRRDGTLEPAAVAARERGVLFEVGHGFLMCSFEVARAMFGHGFYPDILGTDIYRVSIARPDIHLTSMLSKFLALGMSLDRVIRAATDVPARAIGMGGKIGTLAAGAAGDVSMLRLVEGSFTFQGVPEAVVRADDPARLEREVQHGTVRLEPVHTIIAGRRVATAGG